MKRAGNLYDAITSRENLRFAYLKARKGKRGKPDTLIFERNLERNLEVLYTELMHEAVSVGNYRYFTITDPKRRLICAASFKERVLHHAVMNVAEPYFESFQLYDSYACRKGKGTDAALRRTLRFCNGASHFLKMDIRKYFDSIDHEVLYGLICRRFKDRRLLELFRRIIDSYHTLPGKGVPIGNLTSQHFANYYLGFLDHFVKENLYVRRYLRYMDDFLLFSDDVEGLFRLSERLIEYCGTRLQLECKPPLFGSTQEGVPFLQFIVKPWGIYLSSTKKARIRRNIGSYYRNLRDGFWNQDEFSRQIQCCLSHTLMARSRTFRQSLISQYENNTGSSSGSNRVKRGGSWNNNATNCRVANRNNNTPSNSNNNLGFRPVLVQPRRVQEVQ